MDRHRGAADDGQGGLPRASGDGPRLRLGTRVVLAAAPRERGWTQIETQLSVIVEGCPARAGMDPHRRAGHLLPQRLPRASGDGPADDAIA